ncbi:hypothetical protein GWI33_004802 [Rhynchophorus ferrugineus]|uniref:Uncharacterized protein n=1 Tax=Rhynchophorus ferrugineus TaxID=354439 RepID=A0A834ILW3_RHYFE|nr:hypothetical protein GWI33_004802 [Rhynchophorus ferrugineus]
MIRLLCLISAIVTLSDGVFYKSNSTDLTKCTSISYSRTGSKYKEFHPISFKNDVKNGSLIFDFHFAVLASSDAHILLTQTENVTKQDPAYEIVIGAGGNTFSDIRRMQKSDVKASVNIKGLLSALDPRFFWIHFTKIGTQGLLEIGREGNSTSFISWLDPKPLSINFISFSTWTAIEAKWYFDCDRSGNEEEIEKRLTTLEKLRRNLLSQYDPMVRPVEKPDDEIKVLVTLKLDSLKMDERNFVLNVRGTFKFTWNDAKLKWSPQQYGDIKNLHIFRREIWRPELYCLSATANSASIFDDSMMIVNNRGEVTWNTHFEVDVFCDAMDLRKWPQGNYECSILLSSVENSFATLLKLNAKESSMKTLGSSQWIVTIMESIDNFESSLPINFNITSSTVIHSDIFFSPLLVTSCFLLLSFWVSFKGLVKISMGCVQLVIETLMVITLGNLAPIRSDIVPLMILMYSWSMVATAISLMISVMVINVSRVKRYYPLSHIISNILTTRFVKTVLFLPDVVMPEEYGYLGRNSLPKMEDKDQLFWLLLGVAIDRISFIVYSIIVCYMIVLYIITYK